MMRGVARVLIAILTFASIGSAFEFNAGTATGTGQAPLLSVPSATTLLTACSQGLGQREWRVESGYTRLFDLRDLDQFFLAGAWRVGRITGALGISQFGHADLYAEKLAKLSLSYSFRAFTFGGSGSFMALSFGGGYSSLQAGTFGLSMGWRVTNLYFAVAADNLTTPRFDRSSPGIQPRYESYLEFTRLSWSTLGRVTLERKQKPQLAIGQRVTVKKGSALMWGLSTAPLQFGGGVDLKISAGSIGYTVRYHPVLGLTQSIVVVYGSARGEERGSPGLK